MVLVVPASVREQYERLRARSGAPFSPDTVNLIWALAGQCVREGLSELDVLGLHLGPQGGEGQAAWERLQADPQRDLAMAVLSACALQRREAATAGPMAMVMHDLQSDQRAIRLLAEGLLRTATDACSRKTLQHLLAAVDNQDLLTANLLDLEASRVHRKQATLGPVALHPVLQSCVGRARRQDPERKISLRGPRLRVTADRWNLPRVFNNLLSNAIKYSRPRSPIYVTCWHEDQLAVIEVRDEGLGILDEELPSIFDPYFRGAQTRAQGTGLGLTIVSELVRLQNGRVEVESRVGVGTAFRVYLGLSG